MKSIFYWLGPLISLSLAITGCQASKTSAVLGTYEADCTYAHEKLTLNAGGTFIQVVTIKSTGKVSTVTGKWTYSPSDGHVGFDENFISVLDSNGKFDPDYLKPKDMLYSEPVEFWFGKTYLGSSESVLYIRN